MIVMKWQQFLYGILVALLDRNGDGMINAKDYAQLLKDTE